MDYIIGYSGLLILIVSLLLINRHIIGGVGYGFFAPLVVGGSMHMLMISPHRAVLIAGSTILGWITTRIFTNIVHISLYPRYSLYTLLSLGIFVTLGTLYTKQYPLSIENIQNAYSIILLFIIILSSSIKVYGGGKGANSLRRRIHISWFFIISYLITSIIESSLLLSYSTQHPILIIILAIITIMIGGYNGLQLKEMFRFRKLIRSRITQKKSRSM